ncbi:hydroxyacylglutathione hydrolase [Hutsoniella sourekii]
MKINWIKAFEDNYIWVLESGQEAVIVDPGQAQPVLDYLEAEQLDLRAILLTHKHDDHIGGVKQLLSCYRDCPVYGPIEVESLASQVVSEGDSFQIWDQTFQVIKTAGHTSEHVSYLTDDHLFCGDALFLAGCGRVFTGDYQAAYSGLMKLKNLAPEVKVYAGHEYSQTNLKFTLSVEPDLREAQSLLEEVNKRLEKGQASLPSTIGQELKVNLFLQANNWEAFKRLRDQRDHF